MGLGRIARQAGFSLVELVIVIVIAGIVGGMAGSFIQFPVLAYADAKALADLSDEADTSLRKIGRDIRNALPNSLRLAQAPGGAVYLEWIPALAGGRYLDSAAANCFSSAQCGSITSLGGLVTASNQYAGASLVIFNYHNNSSGVCAASTVLPSAYCGNNRAAIAATTMGAGGQDTLTFKAAARFYPDGGSPSRRFHIVDTPVSYVCDPGAGTLARYAGYALQAAQPTAFGSLRGALLARHVTACGFSYQAGAGQAPGLLSLRLTLADGRASVALYHQVQVSNTP